MDTTLIISNDGTTIQPQTDVGGTITGGSGGGTVTNTWKNGLTGATETGFPPANWYLANDGAWYPVGSGPTVVVTPNNPTTVDLINSIIFTPTLNSFTFSRTYIKQSGMAIPTQTFNLFNSSTTVGINVAFNGIDGITFTPQSFLLNPQDNRNVDISFMPSAFDSLPEGVNAANIIVSLTGASITAPGGFVTASQPPLPPPAILPPNVVVPINPPLMQLTWNNGLTHTIASGSAPSNWVLGSDGFWYPPTATTTITPNIGFMELSPILDSTTNTVVANGQLGLTTSPSQDLTTYTIQWNFDVNNQGKGIMKSMDSINPVVSWLLTVADTKAVSTIGYTTRTVSVIITKGTTSFTATQTVRFSNPGLVNPSISSTNNASVASTSNGTLLI